MPQQGDKDRDQRNGPGGVPPIPPELLLDKLPKTDLTTHNIESPSSSGSWGGRVLLFAIVGGIASLFRALFGRKKDKEGT
jgi:hypothetical protein